jgi:chromosome segregation ATPase
MNNLKIRELDEKFNRIYNLKKLTDFEEEYKCVNKLQTAEDNIINLLHGQIKNLEDEEISKQNEIKQIENLFKEIVESSYKLRIKLNELENKNLELEIEYQRLNELRNKYSSDIIKLRKENTKAFDNLLATRQREDVDIRGLKSELCMLLNMLKMRLLNIENEEKYYVGYVMNTSNNNLCYLSIEKDMEMVSKGKIYWKAMNELYNTN